MNNRYKLAMAVAVFGVASLAAETEAQSIGLPGQTAVDNSRGGAVRTRNPGRMVSDGVVRHADFADRQSLGTVISEAPVDDPLPGLIAEALQIVFDQINEAITAFRSLLLVRAGETPSTAASTSASSNTGSTGNNVNSSGGGRR